MTTTHERTAHRIADEIWTNGDVDVIDELYADDCTCTYTGADGPIHGKENLKAYVEEFRTAFPDLELSLVDVIATEEAVACRMQMTGTHEGEFNGIPATDRTVDSSGQVFAKFDEDGRVTEEWAVADNLAMMEQLGVAPEPPQ